MGKTIHSCITGFLLRLQHLIVSTDEGFDRALWSISPFDAPDEITYLPSGAIAAELLVPAREVYDRAVATGAGTDVDVPIDQELRPW